MKKKKSCRLFPALMAVTMLFLSPVFLIKSSQAQAAGGSDAWLSQDGPEDDFRSGGSEEISPGEVPPEAPSLPSESHTQPETPPEHSGDMTLEPLPETSPERPGMETPPSPADDGETPGPEEFFADALIIGDSRAMGLSEYAGLTTPDFFATSGMSVFSLWKKEVSVSDLGKVTLQTLLESKSYGKIYLMLGINELGYDHSSILKKYAGTVETIHTLQPEATLYLCANLHVTGSRSDRDEIYNNANIDWLNAEIAKLAGTDDTIYLDVNPLFDDENGALRSDYSGDETHPYGKYYKEWGQWLYETCGPLHPAGGGDPDTT